jgi:hypothetical protein
MMTNDKMPLHKAVAAVISEIHRLKKDDKNQHGGYAYVSVDDVKDHVRPILAKHGLSLSVTEQSFELVSVQGKNGTTSSALIRYAMTLRHSDGSANEPDIITICLPYTGAQTAGAARSYAVKEWAKGSLLVSTGEKDAIVGGNDADAYTQQDYTAPDAITADQFRTMQELIEKTGTDEAKLLAYVKAESLEAMTQAQYRTADAALRKKMTAPKAEAA